MFTHLHIDGCIGGEDFSKLQIRLPVIVIDNIRIPIATRVLESHKRKLFTRWIHLRIVMFNPPVSSVVIISCCVIREIFSEPPLGICWQNQRIGGECSGSKSNGAFEKGASRQSFGFRFRCCAGYKFPVFVTSIRFFLGIKVSVVA